MVMQEMVDMVIRTIEVVVKKLQHGDGVKTMDVVVKRLQHWKGVRTMEVVVEGYGIGMVLEQWRWQQRVI